MERHELTDEQWEKVSAVTSPRRGRRSVRGARNFVNAVVWLAKTGAPWRDLPERFGSWKTIFNRFSAWTTKGRWAAIFKAVAINDDEVGSLMDGSVVRAHQDSCGGKGGPKQNAIGRSRGGVSTKIHLVTDSRGMPLHIKLTPGQQHDVTMAESLLEHASGNACIADSAYDSATFVDAIEAKGMTAVIENHPNRKSPREVDRETYSLRYKVECCFHSLKRCRRIASRYEKTGRNFEAFVQIACSMVWLGSVAAP